MLHLEINVKRRHIYALVAAVALIVTILPVASWASHQFTDVPDSNIFHDDIGWLADNGITLGCNPPTNDEFCPGDNVRRETMAAFMRRLAENQVVDAKTAITAESAVEADVAGEADNADTLDGIDSVTLLERQAVAGGFVTSGTLSRSFGIDTVTSPATGVYCIALDPALGLGNDEVNGLVSVEWSNSSGSDLFAFFRTDPGACDTDEVAVNTYQFNGGGGNVTGVQASSSVAFMLQIYRAGTDSVTITGAPTTAGTGNDG